MPRRNGSYFGLTVNPTPSVASGIWRVREAEEFLRVNKWPATPGVPGSPAASAGNAQVSLTWSAPTLGTPPTDYQVQYSSNSGSTWTTFADGTSTATSAVVTGLTNGTGYIFRVRAVNALGEGPYGAASGVVTPSELGAALLLHFDGTNGSTTFTDSSPNAVAVTASGAAGISTEQSKFGGSSGLFGAGSYLSFSDGPLDFGEDEDFTIELWACPTEQTAAFRTVLSNYTSFDSGAIALFAGIEGIDSSKWLFIYAGTFPPEVVSTSSIQLNQWTHLAIVRQAGVITMYVNGVAEGSAAHAGASVGGGAGSFIAAAGDAPTGTNYNGYIDELRLVKGTAVYTANFTTPTAPF